MDISEYKTHVKTFPYSSSQVIYFICQSTVFLRVWVSHSICSKKISSNWSQRSTNWHHALPGVNITMKGTRSSICKGVVSCWIHLPPRSRQSPEHSYCTTSTKCLHFCNELLFTSSQSSGNYYRKKLIRVARLTVPL